MKVIITGGAGFIGSHLANALALRGHDVTAFDNLSTGNEDNVKALLEDPNFRLVRGSVLNPTALAAVVKDADAVFHLAAVVGVQKVVTEPLNTLTVNVRGTENVLAAVDAHAHDARVFIASTSEVYGKGARVPFREDDDLVIGPTHLSRWGYACAKALDEFYAFAYAKERGLKVTVMRFFNTTGAGQAHASGMVLPRFVAAAVAGTPVTVYGDGRQTRTFCDVSDTVRALEQLLDDQRSIGGVFNIGSDDEVSMHGLATKVCRHLRSSSEVRLMPYASVYPPGFEDMPRRVPDTARIRTLTGWRPQLGLLDIIDRLAASIS